MGRLGEYPLVDRLTPAQLRPNNRLRRMRGRHAFGRRRAFRGGPARTPDPCVVSWPHHTQRMDESTVRERFRVAFEALFLNDRILLEYNVSERTIATKLQQYLTGVFLSHHIDFEYNRHGVDSKRVNWAPECSTGEQTLVLPDLIVHRRGDDSANLVVCEIKKHTAAPAELNCDRQKLRAIKQQFEYEHAILLVVPVGPGAGDNIILESVT